MLITILQTGAGQLGLGLDACRTSALCPTLGLTKGLIRTQCRERGDQAMHICLWTDLRCAEAFYSSAWHLEAEKLWPEQYRLAYSECHEDNVLDMCCSD
jgi:hypothetical protein